MTIDYRFLSNCAQCNSKIEPIGVLEIEPLPEVRLDEKKLTWKQGLANVVYLFATSIAGMISGAVVLYIVRAFLYVTFLHDTGGNPGENCARGTAFGFLSILTGGFLGTVGGSVLAVWRPPCKSAAK